MSYQEQDQPTTSNYFSIAQADDRAAESTQPALADDKVLQNDKSTARQKRIAAAVERSRTEYKAEHAYTERGWHQTRESHRSTISKKGIDCQRLEAVTTSMYYAQPPEYHAIVELVMAVYDSADKLFGGLSRELIDIALRAAIACHDADAAVELAWCTRSLWKGQFAGAAATASDAFIMAGQPKAALLPLFLSASAFGVHYPIVTRLSAVLDRIVKPNSTVMSPLRAQLERAQQSRQQLYDKPLFQPKADLPAPVIDPAPTTLDLDLDSVVTQLGLDDEGRKALQGTWQRLIKGVNVTETDVGRNVRDL